MKLNRIIPFVCISCLSSTHALAVADLYSRTSATTYATPDGIQHVWIFAASATNLYAASSDGNWTWMDLGQPPAGRRIGSGPSAVSYPDRSGGQAFAVFLTSDDGHLLVDAYIPGLDWQWQELGVPPISIGSIPRVEEPMAITWLDAGGRQVRVFTVGLDVSVHYGRKLLALAWASFTWEWFNLGSYGEVYSPSAVSYHDGLGDHVRVFAASGNHDLIGDAWDGGGWTWYDLTQAPRGSPIVAPNAVAYIDYDGNGEIQVFALAPNGHLVLDAWYGYGWSWFDLGRPPTPSAVSYAPKPIHWDLGYGVDSVAVFVTPDDGRLFADLWNSDSRDWTWFNLGLGMGTNPVRDPTPISYQDASGVTNIMVFAQANNGNIFVDVWDGGSWTWYDLGQP
jgi:hypothetical protein